MRSGRSFQTSLMRLARQTNRAKAYTESGLCKGLFRRRRRSFGVDRAPSSVWAVEHDPGGRLLAPGCVSRRSGQALPLPSLAPVKRQLNAPEQVGKGGPHPMRWGTRGARRFFPPRIDPGSTHLDGRWAPTGGGLRPSQVQDLLVLCHAENCGSLRAFPEPSRDRQGAETRRMTIAGGSRFLTGAVRMTRRNTCDATLVLLQQ